MTFNVINLKKREIDEAWLHLKDNNGELAYADEEKKQPVRIKFKSLHSDAFRKSFLKLNVKLSRLKEAKASQYEEGQEVETEQLENEILDTFFQAEQIAVDMICELAVDWQGFKDQNGDELEFKPEYLEFFISSAENYSVFQFIRESFQNEEAFTQA